MNVLVTINANYIPPLRVMLFSLTLNNPGVAFDIWLLHGGLAAEELDALAGYAARLGLTLHPIAVPADCFGDAPIVLHYSREMYFRLLAHRFLPAGLDRVLYLDPDILVLNPLGDLYGLDLGESLFAAACHEAVSVRELNRLRLGTRTMEVYYNSGVLLMNLAQHRRQIREEEIFAYVARFHNRLVLPDQDVLNALYGDRILRLEEYRYNYDARYYPYYYLVSNGLMDMAYVMANTCLLHFCGKHKPWQKPYSGKFHALYQHYVRLADRCAEGDVSIHHV